MKKLLVILCVVSSGGLFSQNVGIGTNNPLSKLHVAGTIRSDTLIYIGPGVRTLFATPNGRIYDSLAVPSALSWEINGNNNITAAQFLGTTNANDVIFKTNSIERARILVNGNVGIGTNAPSVLFANSPLHSGDQSGLGTQVAMGMDWNANSTGYVASFYNSGTAIGSSGALIKINDVTANAKALTVNSGAIGTGTDLLTVLGNGNTGIGTNAPSERLHVVNHKIKLDGNFNTVANSSYLEFGLNNGTALGYVGDGASGDNNMYLWSYNNDVWIGTGAAALSSRSIYLNQLGNVGIGTLTPANKLEITSGAANTSGLRFTNLTSASPTVAANGKALSVDVNGDVVLMPSASDAWKLLGNAGTTAGINFLGTTDAQDLIFKTNNIERIKTLASNGNVGIAMTTPDARLHIHNDFGVNGTENPILILEQNGINPNNGCSIQFRNDGAGYNSAIAGLDDAGNDGRLEFRTNNDNMITTTPLTSADTRMIILQNGNVGINTLLPTEKFHVVGNAQIGDVLPATGTGNYLTFSDVANNTDVLSLFRTNTLADESTLNVSIGDNYSQGTGIDRFNIGSYLSGSPGFNNIFTVTSQGRAGIGQYNPAAMLHITQPAISGTPLAIYQSAGLTFNAFINTAFGGYTNPAGILFWELGGAETYMFGGEIVPDADGTWNLGASTKRWNTVFATNGVINTSDARLKKDITGLSYGLNDLLKLRPVEYNWNDDALKGSCNGKNLGFLAQDLEKVIPNVVHTPKDATDHYGVNYEALIPVLTKSIQDLNQKLEEKTADLKAMNDAHQAQINELKKMIEGLKK
jgi:hypothetical protein